MLGRGGDDVMGGAAGRGGGGGGGAGRGVDGAGAGAGLGAAAAAGFLAGALARALLRADFFAVFAVFFAAFFAERFLAATFTRPRLRDAAAFFAVLPRFAFFALLAMIDLPIVPLSNDRALPAGSLRLGPLPQPTRHLYRDPTSRSDRVHWPPQSPRHRTSCRPIDQLDRMHHRNVRARRDLGDASDIAGCDHIGSDLRDIRDLAIAQRPRQLRLQDVVRACRAAAEMAVRHIFDHESRLGKNFLWLAPDLLPMLKRARGVIGDHQAGLRARPQVDDFVHVFADIAGQPGHR